jgi:hypothetical protein
LASSRLIGLTEEQLSEPRIASALARARAHARLDILLWAMGVPGVNDEGFDVIRQRFARLVPVVTDTQQEQKALWVLFDARVEDVKGRSFDGNHDE